MKIIPKEEIANLFETIQPTLDASTIITIENEELSRLLHYFLFLKQFLSDIVDHSGYTHVDVLYSQYYWFVHFKHHHFLTFGYDAGMDQQADLLLEDLTYELGEDIDWDLLENINNQLKTDS
jgi:hypothetical protein